MFDEQFVTLDADERDALRAVAERVAARYDDLETGTSYGVAAFRYRGRPLLGLSAARDHLTLSPFSPAVVAAVASRVPPPGTTKGTVRFTTGAPLPEDVVDDLVRLRRAEIDAALDA